MTSRILSERRHISMTTTGGNTTPTMRGTMPRGMEGTMGEVGEMATAEGRMDTTVEGGTDNMDMG